MIQMKTNFSKISVDINNKCNKLNNLKPVMFKISQDIVKEAQLNFRNSKSPTGESWKPLSPLTISMRRGGSSKPLIDRGTLRRSINGKATNTQAIAGTNLNYAAIHQFGGTIRPRTGRALRFGGNIRTRVVIPARPYLGVNNRMNIKYKQWIVNYVQSN